MRPLDCPPGRGSPRLAAGLRIPLLLTALLAPMAHAQIPPVEDGTDPEGGGGPPTAGVAAFQAAATSYPSLSIIGFTNVDFAATDRRGVPSNTGFTEGQFVLHFTSALSSRFTFFAETSLTARRDAFTSPDSHEFEPYVERSILKYTHSDRLKVSIGRYHTPVSYWNSAFHHGQWLQTTVSRPEMIAFGGVFLPVHFLGILTEGTFPARGLNLSYQAGLGNGRSAVLSQPGDAADVNNHRAWLVGLFFKPDGTFGLQVGGALYEDRFPLRQSEYDERILSAHVAWTKETPEILAEFASVRHTGGATGAVGTSNAYYVQAAYRLPWLRSRLKPYARWEELRIEAGDPVFAHMVESKKCALFGVRLDASDLVAVKAEYRRVRGPGAYFNNGIFAQVSFTF